MNPTTISISKKQNKIFRNKATDFHGKEMPKAGSYYTCLAVILILFSKKIKAIINKCF